MPFRPALVSRRSLRSTAFFLIAFLYLVSFRDLLPEFVERLDERLEIRLVERIFRYGHPLPQAEYAARNCSVGHQEGSRCPAFFRMLSFRID